MALISIIFDKLSIKFGSIKIFDIKYLNDQQHFNVQKYVCTNVAKSLHQVSLLQLRHGTALRPTPAILR